MMTVRFHSSSYATARSVFHLYRHHHPTSPFIPTHPSSVPPVSDRPLRGERVRKGLGSGEVMWVDGVALSLLSFGPFRSLSLSSGEARPVGRNERGNGRMRSEWGKSDVRRGAT